MEYTPYARQLRGKEDPKTAWTAFFEEAFKRIDLRELLLDMLRDKFGMIL